MSEVLVDSNVLIDVMSIDSPWFEWSSTTLAEYAERCVLLLNPIVYAEVSVYFDRVEALDAALPSLTFKRDALPWDAAFLAGKCFLEYRRRGGTRSALLPDFYVGSHAAVKGAALLTRDARRYRSYFPRLEIIAPN